MPQQADDRTYDKTMGQIKRQKPTFQDFSSLVNQRGMPDGIDSQTKFLYGTGNDMAMSPGTFKKYKNQFQSQSTTA